MIRLTRLFAGAACAALAACSTYSEEATKAAGAQWSIVPSADGSAAGRHAEGSFAHTQGKLVLIGGRQTPRTDIFDMASCSWATGAAAPFQIHHFQATAANGEIYAIGAFIGGYPRESPVEHVMIYSIANDTWREGLEIPADRLRGAAASVRIGDWIYVIGGAQIGRVGGHVAWSDRFNIATGEWQRLPDAPRARDHAAAAYAEGKIVLGGGEGG